MPLVRETRTRLQQKAVSTQKGQVAGRSRNGTKFESQKVIIGNIGFTRTRPYPFPKVAVSRTERAALAGVGLRVSLEKVENFNKMPLSHAFSLLVQAASKKCMPCTGHDLPLTPATETRMECFWGETFS